MCHRSTFAAHNCVQNLQDQSSKLFYNEMASDKLEVLEELDVLQSCTSLDD